MLCSAEPNSFSLDTMKDGKMAKQESDCTQDYIAISGKVSKYFQTEYILHFEYLYFLGSSVSCVQGSQNGNALTNKYCGQKLNPVKEADMNIAICGKFKIQLQLCITVFYCYRLHCSICCTNCD